MPEEEPMKYKPAACDEIVIAGYLDRRLSGKEQAAFEQRLETDPECRAMVRTVRDVLEQGEAAEAAGPAPEVLLQRVIALRIKG